MGAADQPNSTGANYKLEMKIGPNDLIKFVNSVRLTNSNNSLYPIITIDMMIDTSLIIKYDIFGQKPIDITIMLMGEDQLPKETITFQALYLASSLNLTPKLQQGGDADQDRQPISFQCINLSCYQLMSTGVNAAYEEAAGMMPLDCLTQTLTLAGVPPAHVVADVKGKNTEIINQVLIPPMSVARCIDYLHEKYALYAGALFRYCMMDPVTSLPKLVLKDLSQTIAEAPTVTIWQLPVGDEGGKRQQVMDKCIDEKNYYIDSPFATLNYANSNIITFRYNKIQIVHPEDTLSAQQPYNMDDIMTQYGTTQKKQLVFLDSALKNIETKYCTDLKGFAYEAPYNDSAITSRMSEQIKNTFMVNLSVVNNLRLSNLTQPGSTVKLEPAVNDYMKYAGNYILKNSDFQWTKVGDQWECRCDLQLFRSSRDN